LISPFPLSPSKSGRGSLRAGPMRGAGIRPSSRIRAGQRPVPGRRPHSDQAV